MLISRLGVKTKKERNAKEPIKKNNYESIFLNFDNCYIDEKIKDYNHYRTVNKKLNSTNDRAVSILTTDIYDDINEMFLDNNNNIIYGEFGENITIKNISISELFIGKQLNIGDALIEITESIEPCYRMSNIEQITNIYGKDWWNQKNGNEISYYINIKGNRGYYAKVLVPGIVICDNN